MLYFITVIILIASLYLYFPLARKKRILAGVNNRSSHKKPVITAAGFIFYESLLVYFVYLIFSGGQLPWLWFIGLTILAVVSFVDDLHDVWFLIRLFTQFVAAAFMLWQVSIDRNIDMVDSVSQWTAALMMLIAAVGMFNLHNFMDGLNGMLGGIALSVTVPLLLVDLYVFGAQGFVDYRMIALTIVASAVFMFFNYRKQPKCFSGDVGSIVVGYMIVFFVFELVVKTGNVAYFLFFAVTIIEAGLTVLQRWFAGDNIFAPHRMHLFQLYCNEFYKSHREVSGLYSAIQFAFGMALFLFNYYGVSAIVQNAILWPLFAAIATVYLVIKRKKMGGHLLSYNRNGSGKANNIIHSAKK